MSTRSAFLIAKIISGSVGINRLLIAGDSDGEAKIEPDSAREKADNGRRKGRCGEDHVCRFTRADVR